MPARASSSVKHSGHHVYAPPCPVLGAWLFALSLFPARCPAWFFKEDAAGRQESPCSGTDLWNLDLGLPTRRLPSLRFCGTTSPGSLQPWWPTEVWLLSGCVPWPRASAGSGPPLFLRWATAEIQFTNIYEADAKAWRWEMETGTEGAPEDCLSMGEV